MRQDIIFILIAFIAWRAWLQFFLLLGWFILPLGDKFLGGSLKDIIAHPGLWVWANFDGEHYLAIAHHGYGGLEQAFFPLFPFLTRWLVLPFREDLFVLLISGLTITHLFFLVSLVILYFLVKLDFDKKTAQWSILFLLAFPFSFFFAAFYNESLFFALILGSFYFARRGNWLLAGILGAFASATRLVGLFLLPALLLEFWEQNRTKKLKNIETKKQKFFSLSVFQLIPILVVPLGLLFYMYYLQLNYNDPFLFIHTQPAFGAGRTVDQFIPIFQVFWRYFKMISATKFEPIYFTVWLELLVAIWFLVTLFSGFFKKIRRSYLIFAFLAFITPTLTGTFLSIPRFVLVLFPCFIALSLIRKPGLRYLIISVSLILLAFCTILFTRGYFVA